MVRGIPKDGAGGSHGEEKDGKEDPDDEPKDDEGSSEGQSKENQLCPAPESSESHTSHDQPLSNAQLCLISPGDTIHLCFLRKQHVIAIEIFFQYTLETFLRLASLSREVDVHHFIFWAKTQTNGVK
jgi:maspardin